MRALLAIIILAALGWGAYWFIGSGAAKSGINDWFEARRADGWVAEYDDLGMKGFPNRFDASFSDVSLADPASGLAWNAPFFQILALSYRPNHVIAVWPDSQRVATPLAKYDVTSEDMRASLVLEPRTGLALERATLTARRLTVTQAGHAGAVALDRLTLAAEQVATMESSAYHLGLRATEVMPPQEWAARVDVDGSLPETLTLVRADLNMTFDRPWDRSAIESAPPQPREIRINLAEATWGQLSLQAAGTLSVDDTGQPTGTITLTARNWREILDLARASGGVPRGMIGPLEEGLTLLSRLAGNPKTLDVPLKMASGRVWLGPVPIAKAPVLRLR